MQSFSYKPLRMLEFVFFGTFDDANNGIALE